MKYIRFDLIEGFDENKFKNQYPYPFVILNGILTKKGYQSLIGSLPKLENFHKSTGAYREYGQKSHDRYILEYEDKRLVSEEWNRFISELNSKRYKSFLAKMFGTKDFTIRFHWHYAFTGCSVSPHCDGLTKLGSQIFYLNTDEDWDSDWGGGTLVLKPKREIDFKSNPDFHEFDILATSGPTGNVSFLFQRADNAWHGVKELNCPEGKLRKVFILVIDRKIKRSFKEILKSMFRKIILSFKNHI